MNYPNHHEMDKIPASYRGVEEGVAGHLTVTSIGYNKK